MLMQNCIIIVMLVIQTKGIKVIHDKSFRINSSLNKYNIINMCTHNFKLAYHAELYNDNIVSNSNKLN